MEYRFPRQMKFPHEQTLRSSYYKQQEAEQVSVLTLSRQTMYMYIYMCRTVSPLNSRTATKVVGGV